MTFAIGGSAFADDPDHRVPRDLWFQAMQGDDSEDGASIYRTTDDPAAAKESDARRAADRARVRGRAVAFGEEFTVSEQERRLQVQVSDGTHLLLIWNLTAEPWHVVRTEILNPLLFQLALGDARVPHWPENNGPEDAASALLRAVRLLEEGSLSEKGIQETLLAPGTSSAAISGFVEAFQRSTILPIVKGTIEGEANWRGTVTARGTSFRVHCERLGQEWRIADVDESAGDQPRPGGLSEAEVERMSKAVDGLLLAMKKAGSAQFLVDGGVDAYAAEPTPLKLATAEERLESWRRRFGQITTTWKPRDHIRFPVGDYFAIPFQYADGLVGSIRFIRLSKGWALLNLVTLSEAASERVVDGVASDERGDVLPHVRVRAMDHIFGAELDSTVTDERGEFHFRGLPRRKLLITGHLLDTPGEDVQGRTGLPGDSDACRLRIDSGLEFIIELSKGDFSGITFRNRPQLVLGPLANPLKYTATIRDGKAVFRRVVKGKPWQLWIPWDDAIGGTALESGEALVPGSRVVDLQPGLPIRVRLSPLPPRDPERGPWDGRPTGPRWGSVRCYLGPFEQLGKIVVDRRVEFPPSAPGVWKVVIHVWSGGALEAIANVQAGDPEVTMTPTHFVGGK